VATERHALTPFWQWALEWRENWFCARTWLPNQFNSREVLGNKAVVCRSWADGAGFASAVAGFSKNFASSSPFLRSGDVADETGEHPGRSRVSLQLQDKSIGSQAAHPHIKPDRIPVTSRPMPMIFFCLPRKCGVKLRQITVNGVHGAGKSV